SCLCTIRLIPLPEKLRLASRPHMKWCDIRCLLCRPHSLVKLTFQEAIISPSLGTEPRRRKRDVWGVPLRHVPQIPRRPVDDVLGVRAHIEHLLIGGAGFAATVRLAHVLAPERPEGVEGWVNLPHHAASLFAFSWYASLACVRHTNSRRRCSSSKSGRLLRPPEKSESHVCLA